MHQPGRGRPTAGEKENTLHIISFQNIKANHCTAPHLPFSTSSPLISSPSNFLLPPFSPPTFLLPSHLLHTSLPSSPYLAHNKHPHSGIGSPGLCQSVRHIPSQHRPECPSHEGHPGEIVPNIHSTTVVLVIERLDVVGPDQPSSLSESPCNTEE